MVQGLDIEVSDVLNEVVSDTSKNSGNLVWSVDEIGYKISCACYDFLNIVNFDSYEIIFIEKVLEKVDKIIHVLDIKTLEEVY